MKIDVDTLSNFIREIDGNHKLGAGALAEKIMEFITKEHTILSNTEYGEMNERIQWLDALDAAGVDNWDGHDVACDILHEWNKENV